MQRLDFKEVEAKAMAQAETLLPQLLPGGKQQGREFVCGDIMGNAGKSFGFNCQTGKWADFAGNVKGQGIIPLVRAQEDCAYPAAARKVAEMIGMDAGLSRKTAPAKKKDAKSTVIMPVPDETQTTQADALAIVGLSHADAVFTYRDMQGRLLFYVCRVNSKEWDEAKGKLKKAFYPVSHTTSGWKTQRAEGVLPLYRLERLGQFAGDEVILTEGEACADILQEVLGDSHCASSICGGSSCADKCDLAPLAGRRLLLWPDADEAGEKCADALLARCREFGLMMDLLKLPEGVKPGWDCKDAIEQDGWDRAKILDFIASSRYTPETPEEPEEESPYIQKPGGLPLAAFPHVMQKLIHEFGRTVPGEIAITSLLGLLSALVGRARSIAFREDWVESGNLWLAIVGQTGVGKSPVIAQLYKELHKIEGEETERYRQALAEFERQLKEGSASGLERPLWKQALADDTTAEGLAQTLAANPRGIQLQSDEISGLIAGLERYNSSADVFKGRLLSSFDCQPWKIGRKTQAPVYIPKACVSILGGIQPGRLAQIFEGGAGGEDRESGLLGRFMFVLATRERPDFWESEPIDAQCQAAVVRITRRIWSWKLEDTPVRISSDGLKCYVDWYNCVAARIALEPEEMALVKIRKQAMRVILLLHCLDAALAGRDGMADVSEDCVRRGLMLTDWLLAHSEQCWRLFEQEKAQTLNPVEAAIMAVCVEREAEIAANGYRISNRDLNVGLEEKLGFEVAPERIGKICAKLEMSSCFWKRARAQSLNPSLIQRFKKTVATVVPVANPRQCWANQQNKLLYNRCTTVAQPLQQENRERELQQIKQQVQQLDSGTVALKTPVNTGCATVATDATVPEERKLPEGVRYNKDSGWYEI